MQNLFTGTIAKVASLIAIVIGGYGFAHGEPGAKKSRNPIILGFQGKAQLEVIYGHLAEDDLEDISALTHVGDHAETVIAEDRHQGTVDLGIAGFYQFGSHPFNHQTV